VLGQRRPVRRAVPAVAWLAVGVVTALAVGGVPATAAPKPTLAQVRQQVAALRDQAEGVTEDYDATREKIASLGVRIAAAQTELEGQRKAVDDARDRLGQVAAEVYKSGGLATAALLLSDQPDSYLQTSGLMASLGDRRADAVRDLNRQRQLLVGRKTELDGQNEALQAAQAQLVAGKRTVETKLAAAEDLLRSLTPDQRRQLQQQDTAAVHQGLVEAGVQVPSSGRLTCKDVPMGTLDARVAKVIDYACAQLGRPYQWGADGPGSFDCSGLSMRAWAQAGVSLPHNAAEQATSGKRVSLADAQPGDLLFFYSPIGHDGIYLGSGLMLHAPRTGEDVMIIPVRYMGSPTAVVRL